MRKKLRHRGLSPHYVRLVASETQSGCSTRGDHLFTLQHWLEGRWARHDVRYLARVTFSEVRAHTPRCRCDTVHVCFTTESGLNA
jgi:hypothetical protein